MTPGLPASTPILPALVRPDPLPPHPPTPPHPTRPRVHILRKAPVNTGDTFVDVQGRTWTLAEHLGTGTWGRTWRVRDRGTEAVLKVPLRRADLPPDTAVPEDTLRACRAHSEWMARALEAGHPFRPRLLGTVPLEDGGVGLLMPLYTSVARRLRAGMPLTDALEVAREAVAILRAEGLVHGNLKPSNLMQTDRGAVVLSDELPPGRPPIRPQRTCVWRPPEGGLPHQGWDAWAVCRVLVAATALPQSEPTELPSDPAEGLDKLALAALKDRALARLASEGTNARFRARFAEKLASAVNRGLSREASPSPPYRFASLEDLAPRLDEIASLAQPTVVDVGRLLLSAQARDGVFTGGGAVAFSATVACTEGVHETEDLLCGLRVRDLDASGDGRVNVADARFDVRRHPSGRIRFAFTLPELPPGRYRVRAAFAVRDSGDPPVVTQGAFSVRPLPGYVPPPEDLVAAPIALDLPAPAAPSEAPRGVPELTVPDTDVGYPTGGAEIIEGVFPRPIAPPEDEPELELAPAAAAPPPPVVDNVVALQMPSLDTATEEAPRIAVAGGASRQGTAPSAFSGAPPLTLRPSIGVGPSGPPSIQLPPPPAPIPAPPPATARWTEPSPAPGSEAADDLSFSAFGGEDLPTWEVARSTPVQRAMAAVQPLLDVLRRDTYTAMTAAATASLVLLVALSALLQAC